MNISHIIFAIVSEQDWACKLATFWLVSSISRSETGITIRLLFYYSLRVFSATTNILIYLRNNSSIVLTYRGLNWLTGNESQPGLQLIEKLATPLREVKKIVDNFFSPFLLLFTSSKLT